eukprot:TRINITY_DN11476_c1_g2_i3.p4 TRINITY_DN11476_c1_g2~~TRINITY_DN11476_c1_g2_i3.p4  ORF type:complete len:113 (-),score=17.68 TRINITY_DN11476_c1_g2_i3:1583-1921(-)
MAFVHMPGCAETKLFGTNLILCRYVSSVLNQRFDKSESPFQAGRVQGCGVMPRSGVDLCAMSQEQASYGMMAIATGEVQRSALILGFAIHVCAPGNEQPHHSQQTIPCSPMQ